MFGYATVGSTDFEASRKFYDAVMGALGYRVTHDYSQGGWVGYGDPALSNQTGEQTLWLTKKPFNGAPASAGNGAMVGFVGKSRAQVNAFHAAALANGGSCEGAPGIREAYGPTFYVAYIRDPMGNKFSCVTHKEE